MMTLYLILTLIAVFILAYCGFWIAALAAVLLGVIVAGLGSP